MRALLLLAFIAAAVSSAPVAARHDQPGAEPFAPAQTSDEQVKSNVIRIPAPVSRRSLWASVERVRTVDIPQWAKDQGHNGRVSYTATVGADGELISLELAQSSMSPAIDEAARSRAQSLRFEPATDRDGKPVQGTVRFWMEYARFDKDSPGGGVETYTCGDLVREHDWFTLANADRDAVFVPELSYIILGSKVRIEQGEDVDAASMDADIERRVRMWAALLDRCRETPDRLLLEEVDYPEMYRREIDAR